MDVWIEMRAQLWPEVSLAEHRREGAEILEGRGDVTVFLAVARTGELVGFIEVGTRKWAEGCRTTPVGYVEGWYTHPAHRRQGHGAEMVRAAEEWARRQGCREMASDTETRNHLSQAVHRRLGYDTVATVVAFRKTL